ncbi:MAG: hypothetical protein HY055_12715 [Magnetospirillum sp.]|nr:hypothetical protein [Magnetospirillum sp.]
MSDNADLYGFGAGDAFLVPNTGNDLTPVRFNLQDFQFDIKFDTKTLHGRKSFPLKVARGKGRPRTTRRLVPAPIRSPATTMSIPPPAPITSTPPTRPAAW